MVRDAGRDAVKDVMEVGEMAKDTGKEAVEDAKCAIKLL